MYANKTLQCPRSDKWFPTGYGQCLLKELSVCLQVWHCLLCLKCNTANLLLKYGTALILVICVSFEQAGAILTLTYCPG